MWSSGFTRVTCQNKIHFTKLFLTGSSPESGYELKPNPHTPGATLTKAVAKEYPQAEMWGIYGAHPTVVVRLPVKDSVLWIMRNGDNRGSSNLLIFKGFSSLGDRRNTYYLRTNILQIMQLIRILFMDRNQLPLLIGNVDKINMRVFEKLLKGC
jgi:hypothetical protein